MTDQGEAVPVFAVDVAQSVVLSYSGELDISTAGEMREAFLHPSIANQPIVRVDLTQVTFLDSSARGVLVAGCRRFRASGGAFSMTCSEGAALRGLELSGLIEYLQVEVRA